MTKVVGMVPGRARVDTVSPMVPGRARVDTVSPTPSPAFWSICVLVAQSCPPLCDSVDSGPPGSSVREILQAKSLAWVAIPFSRGSS